MDSFKKTTVQIGEPTELSDSREVGKVIKGEKYVKYKI